MKNKTARSLVQAFDSILNKKRKPEKLRRDKGTEFVNESFQQYLKKQGIQFYTAKNEPKATVVERVNRTLKSKLYRYFTGVNSFSLYRYIKMLDRWILNTPDAFFFNFQITFCSYSSYVMSNVSLNPCLT